MKNSRNMIVLENRFLLTKAFKRCELDLFPDIQIAWVKCGKYSEAPSCITHLASGSFGKINIIRAKNEHGKLTLVLI